MTTQNHPRVSLVILSWARPENIRRIADQECEYELIDELIVFNNNRNVHLKHPHPKARILNCSHDFSLRTRWCAATLARNDVVVLQDDDLVVSEQGLCDLAHECSGHPLRLCGIDGRKPDDANRYNMMQQYGEVPIVLTRCVAFTRELIPYVLKCEQEYEKVFGRLPRNNGEDIFLSYAARSYFELPNLAIETSVQHLPQMHGISQKPGHVATRTEVLHKCQKFFGLD